MVQELRSGVIGKVIKVGFSVLMCLISHSIGENKGQSRFNSNSALVASSAEGGAQPVTRRVSMSLSEGYLGKEILTALTLDPALLL